MVDEKYVIVHTKINTFEGVERMKKTHILACVFMLVFGLVLAGCDDDLDGYNGTVIDYENDIQYQLIEPTERLEPIASFEPALESTSNTGIRFEPGTVLAGHNMAL